MGDEKQQQLRDLSWKVCCTKCLPICSSNNKSADDDDDGESEDKKQQQGGMMSRKRKPGGWKSMPFVLGNETFERLGSIGLVANFMVFLLSEYHMDQAEAANLINTWSGVTNFVPLLGAFISDAYLGRFLCIAFGSFASLLGMVTLTLIAWIPQLHPPPCKLNHGPSDQCLGPTPSQLGVLIMALGLLSIGAGGIRPCSLPFGVDQFDATTDEGRKGINSFFNWYYTTFTVVLIIALTVVVYVQDSVSWVIGFAIPTLLMVCSIVLFFVGMKVYVYVKPEGSVFSGVAQVIVAACKKRKLKLPANKEDHDEEEGKEEGLYYYYDPPPLKSSDQMIITTSKLPLTKRFRFLNKAAVIREGEVNGEGKRSKPWRLSSIQQIEEVKCLIKVLPICASGIVGFVAMSQQGTFTVSQALKMDRHVGPNFQIPPGSLGVISLITVGIWVPLYDRLIVPSLRRITKHEGGITLLQRIGIGIAFSVLSMVVAGGIERMRRDAALSSGGADGVAPMSVVWLVPQLVLMGFSEAFSIIGQIEFYYKEFPENMRSLANSMFFCTSGGANYLSSLLIVVVHGATGGKNGGPDWLTKDINEGKVDYFYFLIAGMGALNMVYFVYCARGYEYKTTNSTVVEEESQVHVELKGIKH